jgi:hypothetical protein
MFIPTLVENKGWNEQMQTKNLDTEGDAKVIGQVEFGVHFVVKL